MEKATSSGLATNAENQQVEVHSLASPEIFGAALQEVVQLLDVENQENQQVEVHSLASPEIFRAALQEVVQLLRGDQQHAAPELLPGPGIGLLPGPVPEPDEDDDYYPMDGHDDRSDDAELSLANALLVHDAGAMVADIRQIYPNGINIEAWNDHGNTPIAQAIKSGRVEAVEELLTLGASVNGVSAGSLTPLHMAVYAENCDMIKLLIKRGASANLEDSDRDTALNIATRLKLDASLVSLLAPREDADDDVVGGRPENLHSDTHATQAGARS
jgi:hypothetical protein